MQAAVRDIFGPRLQAVTFGSFYTGLFLPDGDIDLFLVGQNSYMGKVSPLSRASMKMFADYITSRKLGLGVKMIASARVPIVKFVCSKTGTLMHVFTLKMMPSRL